MLAYIKGELAEKEENFVIIDVGGVGYKVYMPTSSMERLGDIGSAVKVHTHYYVREDNISIYGFYSKEELRMFELLQSVSGIGAKSANIILSTIEPSKFALAIISNDAKSLTKIPGIGAKTAARIILELKDKLKNSDAISNVDEEVINIGTTTSNPQEAIDALKVLGYTVRQIDEVLAKVDLQNLSVEDIIRKVLTILGRQ